MELEKAAIVSVMMGAGNYMISGNVEKKTDNRKEGSICF